MNPDSGTPSRLASARLASARLASARLASARLASAARGSLAFSAACGLALGTLIACRSGEISPTAEQKKTETAPRANSKMPAPRKPAPARPTPARAEPAGIPAPEDVAAPPATAEKSASGLSSAVLTAGSGTQRPTPKDSVKVHYSGWTKDGKMFDSSVSRGEPIEFGVTRVIKGWTEGLQLMVAGEKRRLWIPAELAYGENPGGGRPGGQLTFDVELLEIIEPPTPPPVPGDVAAAPASAKKTASGLRYRVLKKGDGKAHPTAESRVQVHYSGWTKDGKMFDSSVMRGKPSSFGVSGVIKGWTEGLQLMVAGEKTRFWIPADLAYGESAAGGRPAGQLTFDVELIEIQ